MSIGLQVAFLVDHFSNSNQNWLSPVDQSPVSKQDQAEITTLLLSVYFYFYDGGGFGRLVEVSTKNPLSQ
jgi:hypothetical protein